MEFSEVLFLIGLPVATGSFAAGANSAPPPVYWAAAIAVAAAFGVTGLLMLNRPVTGTDLVVWVLVCLLPVSTAFFVARRQVVRGRRLLAAVVATIGYYVSLTVGVSLGVELRVLIP